MFKNFITLILFIFSGLYSFGQNGAEIIKSSPDEIVIKFNFEQLSYKTVSTQRGDALKVSAPNTAVELRAGAPEVLYLNEAIILDDLAAYSLEVIDADYSVKNDILLAPSKGNLTRDIDPSSVPYKYGKLYNKNAYYPTKVAKLGKPYIARDYRGASVKLSAVQYNPTSKQLREYQSVTVKIKKENRTGENPFYRSRTLSSVEKEFDRIYSRHFINYDDFAKYTPVEEEGNMLIICHDDWMAAAEPLVNWKNTIGRPTEMVSVSEAGGTAANIKSYVENYYNTNGLTYLLLIGDAAQLPPLSGGGLGGDSDNAYAYISGDDHYLEFFVGRFSAESQADVETQVNRTIEYERGDQLPAGFLNRAAGLASSEGPGDDDEYDYTHARNMLSDLTAFTYVEPTVELFDGSQGGNDGSGNPTPADVAAELNSDGLGLMTYTGHGSDYIWVSSGFGVSDINSLTNDNKLPFIFDVACVNGNFNGLTCFAEAWMRATNNSEPTGAIAIAASTINQSWAPPMSAQDEMIDILVESYADNIKRSFTGIAVNGMFLMNDEYQDYAMTDTWTTFGDPSLAVRTDDPANMTVTHNESVLFGESNFSVNCDYNGALACLSKDGQIIGTAIVSGGTADIPLSGISPGDELTLAVTGFNKVAYLQDLMVISPEGPYIVLDSYSINGETSIDYNQSGYIDMVLKNVGPDAASNVSVTLTTSDTYINSITDNVDIQVGAIAGNDATATTSESFFIEVADDAPYGHTASFDLSVTDGNEIWTSNLNIPINAPELAPGTYTITNDDNADGILDPGETADINIALSNSGDADVNNVIGQISSSFTDWTINNTSTSPVSLAAGQSADFTFNVTAGASVVPGTEAAFDFNATAGANDQYTASNSHTVIIGFVPEYCESGASYSGDSMIESITIGDMTNESSADCATYSDFTENAELIPDLFIGTTVNFTVQLGTCGGEYQKAARLFIDWNYDGDFDDEGETVLTTDDYGETYIHYDEFTVPADVNPGPKFARIVLVETSSPATISACGSYSYGETEDYKINLVAPEAPQTDFSADQTTISQGDIVNFTDLSTNAPNQWEWTISPGTAGADYEFFGGTNASSQNPQVKFLTDGAYTVELTASNLTGDDTETKTDYITVNPTTEAPVADFEANATDVLSGGIVSFTDLSTNMPTSWTWTISPQTGISFVNGTDANSQNPQVQFDTNGLYTVELLAGNEFGDSDPAVMTDYIEVTSEITIGDGTLESGSFPFNNYYENNRTQIIYEAENFGAQKDLTSLAFDFSYITSNESHRVLTDLSIKLSHTTMSEFSGAYGDNTDAIEVFFAASYTLPGETGWHVFDIDDFTYNGTDNLMVEILWGDNGYYCGSDDYYKLNSTDAGLNVNVVSYGYADYETPPTWDAVSSIRPNIAFEYSEAPVSVENPTTAGNLKLFPNPTDEQFTLVCNEAGSTIEIYSISGQLIKRIDHAEKQTQINLSSQAPGIYIVKVLHEEKTYNLKVVLK